jgi:tetratricopeptide (TPR) repeat protein
MSKRLLVCCASILFAGLSAGHARADDKPSSDEQKRYAAALKRARHAQDAGQLTAAAKAFEDCLQILPDDPIALSELGVVQLRANQLDKAEATSRKAIEHSQSPSVRAASLFNLGYILAKRGDKPGAIEAYQGSLRLRPHPVVEAALRKLDPKAAESLRFVPRAMRAVTTTDADALIKEQCWKSVADAWHELEAVAADVKDDHFHYECTELPTKLALAGTPFLEVRVLRSLSVYSQYPKEVDTLALRTAQGWFVAAFDKLWTNRWGDGAAKVQSVELADVGTAKAIVVRWSTTWDEWPWDADPAHQYPAEDPEGRGVTRSFVAVASLGASGTPSVTPAIPVGFSAGFGETRKPLVSATLAVTFPTTGGVQLTGPELAKTKVPKKKFADLLEALKPGTFELAFP